MLAWGCDRGATPPADSLAEVGASAEPADEPSLPFRNIQQSTAYAGDAACASCHARETTAYRQHAMAQSFHRWTPATRVESTLVRPLHNAPTGFSYTVVQQGDRLYQVELLTAPDGRRIHELRHRIDYVMGSGQVARSYFTEENGRLFQLPLTWYRQHGWDFSPGYEINNARFDRVLPDRCIACHASYPRPLPHLEGKFAELRPGIGCERCHGPGALHVKERTARVARDSGYDNTIVNPARLPLERRLDVCEQCHVHTAVAVLRDGKDAFSYLPSQPLRDQYAFFKVRGGIDIVSHADRLRQSACFIAARRTASSLECATCHDPHREPPDQTTRSRPCLVCHTPAALAARLPDMASRAVHVQAADCVSCHMPRVQEHTVPHGTFTDHWIRVVSRAQRPEAPRYGFGPLEPYFARDRSGPDADRYQAMGGVVYATLATDARELTNAAAALETALASDSAHAAAHFMLGVAQQQLGHPQEAIGALERSVQIDSNRPDALRALAQAYQRTGRTPATIEQLYRRVLALQPALAWIRADYGGFLQAQGRRSDAERAFRGAVSEQPGLAVAWFNLGSVLLEEERAAEAGRAFTEAVHLDPSLAEALSPLVAVGVSGASVSRVRAEEISLNTLPVRERGARAARVMVPSAGGLPRVVIANVEPGATVQILQFDGTPLRTLSADAQGTASWDLLTSAGIPIAGGLYRASIQRRDARGRPRPPQLIYLGIVRPRSW